MDVMNVICFICEKSLDDGKDCVTVKRGLRGLLEASQARNKSKHTEILKAVSEVRVHKECRLNYTRKTSIKKALRYEEESAQTCSSDRNVLRSSIPQFNFKIQCLFCGEETSEKIKKEKKYRRVVIEVRTLEFKKSVRDRAILRDDALGNIVLARIDSVQDLVAAEGRYHKQCHTDFLSVKSDRPRGRPEDKKKSETFEKLCEYLENSEVCQFSVTDLINRMNSFANDDGLTYSVKYLKEKLKAHYGDAIYITDIQGKSSIVNFKETADQWLHDQWYRERMESISDDRARIVKTAAEILRQDIRGMVYDCQEYVPADKNFMTGNNIPSTLSTFLQTLIANKNSESKITQTRIAAIGQAIVSACRPRCFVSPILLSVGVYVHRHFASKQLIQMLSSLGFSVNMAEVKRYEYSAMAHKSTEIISTDYLQFSFDNADFNIRTLDGHATFHCMGGVEMTTPAPKNDPASLKRMCDPPAASDIAALGTFDISWFKKPSISGLRNIKIDALETKDIQSVANAVLMDTLWLSGQWAGVVNPCSWNGFMKSALSGNEEFEVTSVDALPFIRMEPGNLSTIYSALKYSARKCKEIGQASCLVTFDQPLFAKAADIVASDEHGELEGVIPRLGGFHLLMSFLGAIGYTMCGSGIEELWSEVYSKTSVVHMVSGHAYSR